MKSRFIEMRRFIRERFNQPLQQVDLTQAHLFGDSRREADELATPLPVCTPRGAFLGNISRLAQTGFALE